MIRKKSVIRGLEVVDDDGGRVLLHVGLRRIYEDGEVKETRHLIALEPGANVDAVIATNDADITTRPELMAAPIDKTLLPAVKAFCQAVQTPTRVARYRKAVAAAERERRGERRGLRATAKRKKTARTARPASRKRAS